MVATKQATVSALSGDGRTLVWSFREGEDGRGRPERKIIFRYLAANGQKDTRIVGFEIDDGEVSIYGLGRKGDGGPMSLNPTAGDLELLKEDIADYFCDRRTDLYMEDECEVAAW